jgi:DMSO/TMAO reductase YedYZ molybdopterin-dependent catalytic subunit
MIINEDFEPTRGRDKRLPPGQYETRDFPVLSLGPTPEVSTDEWKLEISGLVEKPLTFSWKEFLELPIEEVKKDIHCVTKWSKFDTHWEGVSLDELMRRAAVAERATHLIAHSHDGYSTNLPIEDVMGGKAWVAVRYEGEEIAAEHGGPARLLVPHLYFWKSAKWLKKIEFIDRDIPGFWEVRGYHNYGDPWQEQRYTFD